MTLVQGLLLTVILAALAVVGGILSNWIPRPANVKTRWTLAGLAAVVLVTSLIGLLNDELRQMTSGRRPLQNWVSDVNKSCEASWHRIEAAGKRGEATSESRSIKERVPGLRELEAAHSDLYREVSRIELPSDPYDNNKAEEWLDIYGARRDRLASFVDLIDGLPDSITAAEAFTAMNITQAAQSYEEATTTAARKNEMLGISCP